jgi:hypothetical protein
MSILQQIIDNEPDEQWLKADGFDGAVIGTAGDVLVYSAEMILDILVEEGMTMEDALEHYSYNVSGAYVGDKTPIYVWDMYEKDEE